MKAALVSRVTAARLQVSFLEIYNEEIRDLLHADVSPRDIALREDSEGRIFFTGAREEVSWLPWPILDRRLKFRCNRLDRFATQPWMCFGV